MIFWGTFCGKIPSNWVLRKISGNEVVGTPIHLKFDEIGLALGMVLRILSVLLMFLLIPEVNATPGYTPCAGKGTVCCCLEETVAKSCCAPAEQPDPSSCRECRCAVEPAPMSSGLPSIGFRVPPCQTMADCDFFFTLTAAPRADPEFEIKPVRVRGALSRHPCAMLQRWRC